MNRAIVIADDMTGANDTGAMLADQGFRASSSPTAQVSGALRYAEALTIHADSRAMPQQDVYNCVRALTEAYGRSAALLSKRIDSTLRGNVGAEIDAVLDGLGEPACACVVTAAPRAERVCRDGKVYVAGVALDQTDISRDVRCPIDTADVCELIRRQSARQTALIPLGDVRGELDAALAKRTEDILVFDAETDEDIERIADAVAKRATRVVAIDPGNFTTAYAKRVLRKEEGRTLLLIGSRSEASLRQLEYLERKGMVRRVTPDLDRLLGGEAQAERQSVLKQLGQRAQTDSLLCVTLAGTRISERSRQSAQQISDTFARLGAYVLDAMPQIDLCYASSGDVSQSLLRVMKAQGERLISEVIPLAVYGEIIGGPYHGLRLLTKGGAIGREDAIETLINHARRG